MQKPKPKLDRRNIREDEEFRLRNRLLFRLFKTTNVLHTAGTKWTSDRNLTTQQWSVIGALSRPGFEHGTGVGELSGFLQVTRQNLSGLLDRLEKQGITQRVPDPSDGRARLVQLTGRGWKIWNDLVPVISSFYGRALESFTREETEQFLFFIDKLQANLRNI